MQASTGELPQSHHSLKNSKVWDIVDVEGKKRLVEVPYTATLADTMNALVANRVVAMPVAAPPGHWIGAGGSMIMESDKQTGAVRKHYIGMVTMLDILAHIAGDECEIKDGIAAGDRIEQRMSDPVSAIIGHCPEGLSLWTLNPNTSILDCMEVFSKGIHRAMVPMMDSHMYMNNNNNNMVRQENISIIPGVELVESSSSYKMLTQMDVIRFLRDHASTELYDTVFSKSLTDLRALSSSDEDNAIVFAVTDRMRAIDAVRCLKNASLQAVPIVEAADIDDDQLGHLVPPESHAQLINGHGRKLVGTFSTSDVRGCPVTQMQSWLLNLNVMDFVSRVFHNPPTHGDNSPRIMVTCRRDSTLAEVIDMVLTHHVHRVWVLDDTTTPTPTRSNNLIGLVSLTDIIRAIRAAVLQPPEPPDRSH